MRELEIKALLKNIKDKETGYKKVLLKEFFIKKLLAFFYTNTIYKDFVFTGGTCLRILYDLPRLSEGIDVDLIDMKNFDAKQIKLDIESYFHNIGNIRAEVSIRSQGRTINVKLPILKTLGVVPNNPSESHLLYIKIDTSFSNNPYYQTKATPYFKDGYSFVIKHYDLPSLFAGKLTAIFGRGDKLFHDKYNYKGRDFFDLIWYLQQGIKPNFRRLQFELSKIGIDIKNIENFITLLEQKIKTISSQGIQDDLHNMIESKISIQQFADNFKDIFDGLKGNMI